MFRYEVLMLAIPAITQDEYAGLEAQVQNTVQATGATVLSFERWGKFRLAYPVNRNEYGVYILMRIEVKESGAATLDALKVLLSVDLRHLIMRFVSNILDVNSSLEYHRPPSLEETPPKEVGTSGRGEGRTRYEGRGGRPGFNRNRGPRTEGEYSGRHRQGYDSSAHHKNESSHEQDSIGNEVE